MSSLKKRLKRLEDPRTPAQRKREEEAARKSRQLSERIEERYRQRAEEWPEGYQDLLRAGEELNRALEAEGMDLEQAAVTELRHPNTPTSRALRKYQDEQDRFWHGYTCGTSCEDCGRPGEPEPGKREGRCEHCGGMVGNDYYFYKRVRPLEGLKVDIAASRGMGHNALASKHEELLLRRLRDVGS